MGALKYRYAIEKVYELFGRTDKVRETIDPFTMTFSKSKA
jgi:ribosomal protein L20A (L18A)